MNKRKFLPRVTIEISEDMKHAIRVKAVNENLTITKLVTILLKKWLADDKSGS